MTDRTVNTKLAKIKQLKLQKAQIENEIEKLENSIKAVMGDFEELETDKYIIHWTRYVQMKFDKDRFMQNNKTIYESYLKECKQRRFTFSEKKGIPA